MTYLIISIFIFILVMRIKVVWGNDITRHELKNYFRQALGMEAKSFSDDLRIKRTGKNRSITEYEHYGEICKNMEECFRTDDKVKAPSYGQPVKVEVNDKKDNDPTYRSKNLRTGEAFTYRKEYGNYLRIEGNRIYNFVGYSRDPANFFIINNKLNRLELARSHGKVAGSYVKIVECGNTVKFYLYKNDAILCDYVFFQYDTSNRHMHLYTQFAYTNPGMFMTLTGGNVLEFHNNYGVVPGLTKQVDPNNLYMCMAAIIYDYLVKAVQNKDVYVKPHVPGDEQPNDPNNWIPRS